MEPNRDAAASPNRRTSEPFNLTRGQSLDELPTTESTPFNTGSTSGGSWLDYGTTPNLRRSITSETQNPTRTSNSRIGLMGGSLSRLSHRGPSMRASLFSGTRRPKSHYDHIFMDQPDDSETYVNGIRMWYKTFTSIDWLHDWIKESSRVWRLRRRKSLRWRLFNEFDRSLGWIVVSIVGFLTAIVAFIIVRLEKWLFDIKEGYCASGWWRSKNFCCPVLGTEEASRTTAGLLLTRRILGERPPTCLSWRTWAEVLGRNDEEYGEGGWVIEYAAVMLFALILAFTSALLTVKLTASTSFVEPIDGNEQAPLLNSTKPNPVPGKESNQKRKVMYFAAGSGIPELKVILGGFVMRGYLGGRTLFTKSIGLSMSVASGLTLGKEGPFVHIACCLGNIVSRWFTKYETNEAKRREILSAACAAGVAVAFGAPVGGVLFSLEEVSYFFPPKVLWRSFFCAMIAAATLRSLDPFDTGKLVLFQVTYDQDYHSFELLAFLLLGLFGGVFGGLVTKLHVWWVEHFRSIGLVKRHPIGEVLGITVVTVLLCFLNPYTRMGGVELVSRLFTECHEGEWLDGLCVSPNESIGPVVKAIAAAMVIKGLLTAVTFGIKVPAGVFIPTLGVGACFGRILGLAVQSWQRHHPDTSLFSACLVRGQQECIIPGMYAMVGAAATLSGVTRTTISLAVIMFELTRTMNYVVPVMLAVLVAKNVADLIQPQGIYDCVIELAQLPYLEIKHDYVWGTRTLQEVTDVRRPVIRSDQKNTVSDLQAKLDLVDEDDGGFPVLNKDGSCLRLEGFISTNELSHALAAIEDSSEAGCHFYGQHQRELTSSISSLIEQSSQDPYDLSPYLDQSPLTVNEYSPLELVHQIFTKLGARYIIVISGDGSYTGLIDRKMWISFVSRTPQA